MGEYKDHRGLRAFRPDDTDDEFYISCSASLADIIDRCGEKWPGIPIIEIISMEQIEIDPMYIHTDCLGYDLYDAGDYTNYLCIRRVT